MPRYSANLTMLWPEISDPYARFAAASEAGFTRVERLFAHDLDRDRVRDLIADLELDFVLFDPYPGDWDAGERGLLALPGREAELREAVLAAIDDAERLGTRLLNVLSGILPPDLPRNGAMETAAANLAALTPAARAAGITLLVEPINALDWPGYAVPTIGTALELIRQVSDDAVRLQFDVFHVARSGEDILALLDETIELIGHVQIADVPGRHHPGSGTLPLATFLERLDDLGYRGTVGLEFIPEGETDTALEWLPRAARR